jgi:E3 ubiquitin-protein ligase HUWE1
VESISFEYLQSRSFGEMKSLTQDLEDDEVNTHHNYLEILLRLLRYPQLTENNSDMLQLTRLIDQLCEPLEILKEVSSQTEQETPNDELFADDFRWVRVPAVPLPKSSLKALCDALMSEFCTKEVFDHIISTISRLACVRENCCVLMEVLVEVILDLSLLSSSRIQTMIAHLVEMSKLSAAVHRALSIPLGEIGSQDHLRLFRALQMLQTLCTKVGKSVTEVLPSDEFHSIWQSTDHMLRLLESHFIPADSLEKFDQKKQLNSTLSSILSKILPLIEGFFLVHTVDLLNGAPGKIDSTNDSTQKPEGEETTQPSSVESLPGAKYRSTEAFKKANISLFGDGDRELQHGTSLSRLKSFQQTRSLRSNPSFDSASSYLAIPSSGPHRLLSFVNSHRNILNLLIRWYPALLDTSLQSFIRIVQLRSYLSFDSKRIHFYSQLKQRRHSSQTHHRSIHLQVHRETIFEESFNQLRFRSADEMKGRLVVSFADEEGIDAGGLTREWFGILTREIFNPNYCLFTAAADGATFQPNPYSAINTNHLDYFKFVGKVFGKAVVDGFLLDGHFTRSFYKHVLGIPVEYNDIEGLEPEYFKSLKQILEFPLEDLGLELTFSAESQTFGRHQVTSSTPPPLLDLFQVVDLVPNGRNIAVTDQNKTDYIRLISHHSMTSAIHSQITSFLDGFYELVPVEMISVFTPTELELLISGLPDIDIDDLRIHTDYHQYRAADEIIQWFWNILRGFSREEKALFLQFVTGTSKVCHPLACLLMLLVPSLRFPWMASLTFRE